MTQSFATNPRQAAMTEARELLTQAVNTAMEKGLLPAAELPEFIVEVPADVKNGDIASNLALARAPARARGRFARIAVCTIDQKLLC